MYGQVANFRAVDSKSIPSTSPLNELRERLDELDKNQAYIVSCHSGLRSYIAERILKQAGFTVQNLDGAYSLYKMAKPEGVEYGN